MANILLKDEPEKNVPEMVDRVGEVRGPSGARAGGEWGRCGGAE